MQFLRVMQTREGAAVALIRIHSCSSSGASPTLTATAVVRRQASTRTLLVCARVALLTLRLKPRRAPAAEHAHRSARQPRLVAGL